MYSVLFSFCLVLLHWNQNWYLHSKYAYAIMYGIQCQCLFAAKINNSVNKDKGIYDEDSSYFILFHVNDINCLALFLPYNYNEFYIPIVKKIWLLIPAGVRKQAGHANSEWLQYWYEIDDPFQHIQSNLLNETTLGAAKTQITLSRWS